MKDLRSEEGFGLIELLVSMMMLNIGILAIVAAFNSGAIALKNAGEVSTASVIGDKQMELYRALNCTEIALDTTAVGTANGDTTDQCDFANRSIRRRLRWRRPADAAADDCGTMTRSAIRVQTVTGPDRALLPRRHLHRHRDAPERACGQARDRRRPPGSNTAGQLARMTSTFDESTG